MRCWEMHVFMFVFEGDSLLMKKWSEKQVALTKEDIPTTSLTLSLSYTFMLGKGDEAVAERVSAGLHELISSNMQKTYGLARPFPHSLSYCAF